MQLFPFVLLLATVFFAPYAAHAYIDPGTTSSAFGLIATLISGAGIMFAFLIRPIKLFFVKLRHRKAANSEVKKEEQPPSNQQKL